QFWGVPTTKLLPQFAVLSRMISTFGSVPVEPLPANKSMSSARPAEVVNRARTTQPRTWVSLAFMVCSFSLSLVRRLACGYRGGGVGKRAGTLVHLGRGSR